MIKIETKQSCCGCMACEQACPHNCLSFKEDKEGFCYPKVSPNNCVECGSCINVCPIINSYKTTIRQPLSVYASKNRNETIRLQSSSGGIFSLLAEEIIQQGGVVFGARFDQNWEVIHDYSETVDGLAAFRGSKYVQSKIGDSYQKVRSFLRSGRMVLFSGTPCQIAGLQSYLRKSYDNLLCVDCVCHGIPSPKVWRCYLRTVVRKGSEENLVSEGKLVKRKSSIVDINFREKSAGWKKFSFAVSLSKTSVAGENNIFSQSHLFTENSFMKVFLHDIVLRPSCYSCHFREGRSGSDITIGDFWGIEKILPDFDDDKGVSLVMVNTEKGKTFFPVEKVKAIPCSYADAIEGNSAIIRSPIMHNLRNYFFYMLSYQKDFNKLADRCVKRHPAFFYRVLRKIRVLN